MESRYMTKKLNLMLQDNQEGKDGVGVGGRFKREGPYVYLWLIYIVVWQKSMQHCKATIL